MLTTMLVAAAMLTTNVPDTTINIKGVTVTGQSHRDFQMRSSQTAVLVNREFMEANLGGSLMQTLEAIPGVKAMSIGSSQSKPTIRGLGFNRLAVTEDGIKHEGQQWGDDHGLEIDQFAIDRAEVIKGPAALLYGSDAIGGVLSLYTNHVPTEPFGATVQLFGRTNNEQVGLSAKVGGRKGSFFYRANATVIDYGDYSVPTDSIEYFSYNIALHNHRLRNTAGRERDGSLMLGYAGYHFHTDVRLSDSYAKSGFFANAHGLEVRLSQIDYDSHRRDTDLPCQWVNHLKVLSHTTWRTDELAAELNIAFQNNLRQEMTEPLAHGYMPTPPNEVERRFNKNTWTLTAAMQQTAADRHQLSYGLSGELQHNRRSGWGFVIPNFETATAGAYVADRLTLTDNLTVNGGVRYDVARTSIHSYTDWYDTPQADGSRQYVQRASDAKRTFGSLTWSAGVNYAVGQWTMKVNVGKSFRVPIAKELGADGINYHIFRYERGNARLDPEESYQADASLLWTALDGALTVQADPYVNYFPNFIYLNPTATDVEGLQLYEYTQARVLRYGFEAEAHYAIDSHFSAALKGEYLYARQKSGPKKGYTLPFSTPWSVEGMLKYSFDWHGTGFATISGRLVGAQHEIVPPEKPTDGYFVLGLSAGKQFHMRHGLLKLQLHADNLLNRRYYDHTSYYRLINVPEPGRNVSVTVGVEI